MHQIDRLIKVNQVARRHIKLKDTSDQLGYIIRANILTREGNILNKEKLQSPSIINTFQLHGFPDRSIHSSQLSFLLRRQHYHLYHQKAETINRSLSFCFVTGEQKETLDSYLP